jgi:tripartite-type tricarboxylate transporter receptor subunit TctC
MNVNLLPGSLARIGALVCSLLAAHAAAQGYPAKAVRVIVPFTAGGAVDTSIRAVGQKLTELWKQPIVVDNRAGAGGNIGADAVAKAAPDGYTLLCTSNALALSPALYRKLPYDAARDFIPLAQFSSSYQVLTVIPKLPVNSVRELIEYAKAKPGAVTYGSTGIGAAPHLITEQFKLRAGIELLHVPYKGDVNVTAALLAGEVDVAFMTPSSVLTQVKAGKLRALGVTKTTRAAAFDNVPPIADTLPGFEYSGYVGLYAPAGTPRDVVSQIQRDAARVLAMPDLQERLAASGFEPPNTTPDQFAARYHRDIATFVQVVKDARIPQQE